MLNKSRQVKLRCFFWWLNVPQVRIGIKGRFKLLRVDFTVIIQYVRVNLCNHINLGMAGVTEINFQKGQEQEEEKED